MYLDSRNVADALQHQATDHADHEAPCPVEDAETQLREDEECEQDGEEEVTAIRRQVEEVGLGQAACFQCAVLLESNVPVAVGVRVDGHVC